MNTPLRIATGFITGTLLGALMMLLLAPRRGSQARKPIGDQAKDVLKKFDKTYSEAPRRQGLDRKQMVNMAV